MSINIREWIIKTQVMVVTTMQALSGAGYPSIASLNIVDNVIAFIASEEEKIAEETREKSLGHIQLSAHCNRVLVRDGHLETISIALANPSDKNGILEAW